MLRRIGESLFELKQGDITREAVDAIVNAANSALVIGGGVDGAIHRAGGPTIHEESARLYPEGCPTGSAVATGAGLLPAKWVFHAVGPRWQGGRHGEAEQLRSACQTCLELAIKNDCRSIAFPAISTGIFGFPMDRAAEVLCSTIIEFLNPLPRPLEVRMILAGPGPYGAFARVLEELLPG